MKAEKLMRLVNEWHSFLLISPKNNHFPIALPERQQIVAFDQDRTSSNYWVNAH
jgi:hypothetical protein